jgi:hypothetical protein
MSPWDLWEKTGNTKQVLEKMNFKVVLHKVGYFTEKREESIRLCNELHKKMRGYTKPPSGCFDS